MAGRLIYLIGPSGSGKDSLLDAARPRLAERGCRIVRRVITRSAEAVGEAQSLSLLVNVKFDVAYLVMSSPRARTSPQVNAPSLSRSSCST